MKKILFLTTTLLLLTCLIPLKDLKIIYNVDDLIEPHLDTYSSLKKIKDKFNYKNNLQITFYAPKDKPLSNELLCDLDRWINRGKEIDPRIKAINSPFAIRKMEFDAKSISYPRVLNLACFQESKSKNPSIQTPWLNLLYQENSKAITVEFSFIDTPGQLGSFNPNTIAPIVENLNQYISTNGLDLNYHLGGAAAFQYYMFKAYDNTQALNGLIVVFTIFIFWLLYGTFRSSLWLYLTLFPTVIVVHATMAILGYPVDVLSNCLFIMLTISTIQDFMFVSNKLREHDPSDILKVFRELRFPSFMTSLTTIIGFASLALSDLGIIRRFGIIAAWGALLEWFFLFILFPKFIKYYPQTIHWIKPRKTASFINKKLSFLSRSRFPRSFSKALLIVFPLSFFAVTQLFIDDSPMELFHDNHPFSKTVNYYKAERGYTSEIQVIFKNYEAKKKNQSILKQIKKHSNVSMIEDIYSVMDFYTPNERFWPHVYNSITTTPAFTRLVAGKETMANIMVIDSDINAIQILSDEIRAICKNDCEPAGSMVSYTEFAYRIPITLLRSFIVSIVLVLITLLLLARHLGIKRYWLYIISSFWGTSFLICILSFSKTKIYFITCIVASILAGLAGDNAIQYMFEESKGNQLEKKGLASIEISLTLLIMPLIFLLSHVQPVVRLGALFSLGIICSLIGDYWILKSLKSPSQDKN